MHDGSETNSDSFTITQVSDGLNVNSDGWTVNITVNYVNDETPDVTTNTGISLNEGATKTIVNTELAATDADVDTVMSNLVFTVGTAPGNGALKLSGTTLNTTDTFTQDDIDTSKITYVHDDSENHSDSFTISQIADGGGAGNTNDNSGSGWTVSISVTPVNDAPTAANETVTTDEDTTYDFKVVDFNFSDVDIAGDTLQQVMVTSVAGGGALKWNGSVVLPNIDEIPVADITAGGLTFEPALNASGTGYGTFEFKVHDGTVYSASAYTMTIDVTEVNDPPTSSNNTVTATEDTTFTFEEAHFPYMDTSDSPPDPFTKVKITSLETAGTLTHTVFGDVTLNQEISVADINANKLTFAPAADANGVSYDSFGFKVSDGQIVNDYSVDAYTMTINVTAINDMPSFTKGGDQTVVEGAGVQTVAGWATAISAGPSNESGQALTFNVSNNNTGLFSSQPAIDSAGKLTYTPVESGVATVTVTLTDDATAGGAALTTIAQTFIVTVTDINPVADFTVSDATPNEGVAVNFTDNTSTYDGIIDWTWNFGDGTISEEQNPSHTYAQDGTYTVTLNVEEADLNEDIEIKTGYITVIDTPPSAVFSATPTSGDEPLEVAFLDESTANDTITDWLWDFGDGSPTSDVQHPTHTFTSGTHTVTLTVWDAEDFDSTTDTITVNDSVPVADFAASPTAGEKPLTVSFANTSTHTGSDTTAAILWDFGHEDLTVSPIQPRTSSVESPSHTYTAAGTYTVTLTVTDNDGSSDTAIATINVSEPAVDTDLDGDLWFVSDGDCKDDPSEVILDNNNNPVAAADINPGAPEVCGNGVDEDCYDGDRTCPPAGAGCLDLADSPLDVKLSVASPNIMFVLDDSESMDYEFLTADQDGLWWIGSKPTVYLYNTADNISLGYQIGGDGSQEDPADKKRWKYQSYEYNRLYYNPDSEYLPWEGLSDANPDLPWDHPVHQTESVDLDAIWLTFGEAGGPGPGIMVDDSHGSPSFTATAATGSWTAATDTDAQDDGYLLASLDEGGDEDYTVTWTPVLPGAGDYEIWVKWISTNKRALSVTYTITHNGGTSTVTVDQKNVDGSAGIQLGGAGTTYTFNASGSESVSIQGIDIAADNKLTVAADSVTFVPTGAPSGAVIMRYSHYFTWSATNSKAYLVNLDGTTDTIKYYEVVAETGGSGSTGSMLLDGVPIGPAPVDENIVASLLETATPPADIVTGRTFAEERQNFANWFQYYRKRWFTVVAAVTRTLPGISGVNVGYRMINGLVNGAGVEPVQPIDTNRATLISQLEGFQLERVPGMTPLRKGLNFVGLYYHMTESTGFLDSGEPMLNDANCPISTDEGGQCQQNFAVVLTDGSWNGGPPTGGAGGNNDGDNGDPYEDGWQSTLGDVAMYFWENDLAPTVDNEVPTNFVDKANWQHMVTYGIGFGIKGHLEPDDYDLYNIDVGLRDDVTWPKPQTSDPQAKIDDIWHAAVNGRGKYLSAENPEELIAYFQEIMNDLMSRVGSGASVSINGEELDTGTVVYQSIYSTEGWSGDVMAYPINLATGEVLRDTPIWSAEELLYARDPNSRIIATYDGTVGMPFRYDDTTVAGIDRGAVLMDLLDSSATTAQNMINFLRGDSALEEQYGGNFRNRKKRLPDDSTRHFKLGDIVSSAPLYQTYLTAGGTKYGVLYVGANDGMLHAFDADNGEELFAYVPKLVFENLKDLTQIGYPHRYYVNLTPFIKNVGGTAMLVGGLGKGGKGYYALDVSEPRAMLSEGVLASKVLWEYPWSATTQAEIDDMGFSYSRAFIAQSNDPAHPWVVIFGNGYNSPNEKAVLFILDATTGTLIKKIDTGVGGCNGLSEPILIDPIGEDGKVDYVYAGDLKGNMWKFDLTSPNAQGIAPDPGWTVAYIDDNGNANPADDIPKPLFTAKDDNGNIQPITAKPDVMRPCNKDFSGYFVVFGTGRYLGLSDFSNTSTQTLYGVWDYGDDSDNAEHLGEFNRGAANQLSNQPALVTMLEQEEIFFDYVNSKLLRVLTDTGITHITVADLTVGENPDPSPGVANHAGWYFDLTQTKERMVRDLLIRGGKAIIISTIPNASACSAGGESILLEVNACTGGRVNEPVFDINEDDVIDAQDKIEIPDLRPGAAEGATIWVVPTGLWFPTMLYPPTILRAGEEEIKLMSTAAGNVIDVRETAEQVGMYYWLQIK